MTKQIQILLLFLAAVVFFYSCEKESLEQPLPEPDVNVTEDTTEMNQDGVSVDTITVNLDDQDVTTRSIPGRELIKTVRVRMDAGKWYRIGYSKAQLTKDYRYFAVTSTFSGDPDLYVHGSSGNGTFRYIRSDREGLDGEMSGTIYDLTTTENYLYFSVYARKRTDFNFHIYREPICLTSGCLAGRYMIKSALGTYLDIQDKTYISGANVIATSFGDYPSHRWTLIPAGGNYYYIKSDLGTYLDVKYGSSASGTNVWAYGFNGSTPQKWLVFMVNGDGEGHGRYYIQSALGTYLDVYNASPASGTNVWAYQFNSSIAQKWELQWYYY